MILKNKLMIGFGISDNESMKTVFKYASGAIIGSAFIKALDPAKPDLGIANFMNKLLNN